MPCGITQGICFATQGICLASKESIWKSEGCMQLRGRMRIRVYYFGILFGIYTISIRERSKSTLKRVNGVNAYYLWTLFTPESAKVV